MNIIVLLGLKFKFYIRLCTKQHFQRYFKGAHYGYVTQNPKSKKFNITIST